MRTRISVLGAAMLAACTPTEDPTQEYFAPEYLGIETRRLDDDLVSFLVRMRGARTKADVADYGKCAAAQYALIRGFGFARHVRTNVQEEGGLWAGDAVYTISAALPDGLQTIDAEVAVAECAETGIPTV
ncbi:hypothetical protein SAMN05444273_101482 [Litoreibacter ascidiaceicola]|uniref:Lipoprotein n=1 Tax=Litoreibacter ascidiaceicola TaxID=1486859 RepID=A0A1M4TNW7_9RHOB|nr:hypothetical protein SAMN05444273_101482 [Litoreibacter ascidiaceicola]